MKREEMLRLWSISFLQDYEQFLHVKVIGLLKLGVDLIVLLI